MVMSVFSDNFDIINISIFRLATVLRQRNLIHGDITKQDILMLAEEFFFLACNLKAKNIAA